MRDRDRRGAVRDDQAAAAPGPATGRSGLAGAEACSSPSQQASGQMAVMLAGLDLSDGLLDKHGGSEIEALFE